MADYNPKVSVIVPVYHSEPYLERCCRSLFCQTLDDLECLFILDGPSETAEQIIARALKDYPLRQRQVKILKHAENRGISFSRQEGHEEAGGQYIYHCDSDDWLEPDALQEAYTCAQEGQADLVFFDYVRHYEDTAQPVLYRSRYVENGLISTMDGTLCNKLIRHQLVTDNQLRFPEGINWGEDLCMSVLLQICAKQVKYLPKVFYHYCMRPGSITTVPNKDKYLQLITCPQFVGHELQKRQLSVQYAAMLLQMKFEVKEYYLIHPQYRDIQQWKITYPECHSAIWSFSGVPIYLKGISWLAANHLPHLAYILLSCRDIYHSFHR